MRSKWWGHQNFSSRTIALIVLSDYLSGFTIGVHCPWIPWNARRLDISPTKPPSNKASDLWQRTNLRAKAFTFATSSSPPQQLLLGVSAIWRELSTYTCGDTYHTATPSIYFQQTVSLLYTSIANHFSKAQNRLTNHSKRQNEDDIHDGTS